MSEKTDRHPVQADIVIRGKVQQVGFRDRVANLAKGMGLSGFVENLREAGVSDIREQPVLVVVQGRKVLIEQFISAIRHLNEYIRIDKIDAKFEENPDHFFEGFYIHRQERIMEELGPRIDTAIDILKSMDRGIKDVKKEVMNVKDEVSDVKKEVMNVKDAVRNGFGEMSKRFDVLDGKYHTVSEELTRIREILEESVGGALKLKERPDEKYVVKGESTGKGKPDTE